MNLFLALLPLLLLTACALSQTIDRDNVRCDLQQKVCECRENADECEFTLVIEKIQTFTSYTIEEVDNDLVGVMNFRGDDGSSYYFNGTGHLNPLNTDSDHVCVADNENFDSIKCTVPYTADGKTYRPFIAVNGITPGPTLIVYEGQRMIVNIVNRLLSESTSIHWHGMDMRNTPWMDGVVLVTQCPIDPFETFQYYFEAAPTGTFWYHAHRVDQRVDGLFGGLIVRESSERRAMLNGVLGSDIVDNPGTQTMHLHEWAEATTSDQFIKIKGGLGFFPGKPYGEIPLPLAEQNGTAYTSYEALSGPDGLEVGDLPFVSGLINGRGKHIEIPYIKTRLEIFSISNDGRLYRFRLIGVQSIYMLKFSIDEHNLTVIATDGNLIEPIETQFIILHTGERYDFVLRGEKPRNDKNDYWIRAETLELDLNSAGPPYTPVGNLAEGILHYQLDGEQLPQSSDYEAIKQSSIPFDTVQCGKLGGCTAINCPFREFHPLYNIHCIHAHELRRLEPLPLAELPEAEVDPDCEDCEIFFNIGSDNDALNGRNMKLPPAPPLTQRDDLPSDQFCNVQQPCPNNEPCSCTHLRNITSFNKTIRIVLSSVGKDVLNGESVSHPFHLHGHQFQVVYIGFGSYNESTGFLSAPKDGIICDDTLCSNPSWAPGSRPSFETSDKTVLKDTVIVPGGGYVVIHFRSNNPGLWLLHCHIVPDLLEGMSVMIDEVRSQQNPAPDNINICGNFKISQSQFYEKLAFNPSNSATEDIGHPLVMWSILCLDLVMLLFHGI